MKFAVFVVMLAFAMGANAYAVPLRLTAPAAVSLNGIDLAGRTVSIDQPLRSAAFVDTRTIGLPYSSPLIAPTLLSHSLIPGHTTLVQTAGSPAYVTKTFAGHTVVTNPDVEILA